MLDWLRGRGNAETGPRDGEAPVLERLAVTEPAIIQPVAAAARPATPQDLRRDVLLAALSRKVLGFHLANRFQTSYPLVLNFRNIGPDGTRLLTEVAAAALLSDPRAATHGDALKAALVEAKAGPEAIGSLDRALAAPRPLSRILPEVLEAGLGPEAYAVSLLALGRANATGRHHLAYLAARLSLGEEIVGSLNRRFQR